MIDFIYDKSLTETEARFCLEYTKANLELDRLQMAFEACEATSNYYNAMSELKVYEESGTYEDLGKLYQEAEAEVANKKQGIISKMIDVIKNKINSILAFIKGKRAEANPDEEVEVAAEALTIGGKIQSVFATIKSMISKFLASQASIVESALNGDLASVGKVVAEITATVGVILGGKVAMKKVKTSQALKASDSVDKTCKEASGLLDKLKNKIGNGEGPFSTVGNKVIGFVQKFIDNASKVATHLLSGAKEAVSGAVDNAKEKVDDAKTKHNEKVEAKRTAKRAGKINDDLDKVQKGIQRGNDVKETIPEGSEDTTEESVDDIYVDVFGDIVEESDSDDLSTDTILSVLE